MKRLYALVLVRDLRLSDFDDMVETFLSFFPEAEADPSFGLVLHSERPTLEEERRWYSDTLKAVEAGDAVLTMAEVDSHVVGWCDVRRVGPGDPSTTGVTWESASGRITEARG